MALPKIDLPLFQLEIPSTKQKVNYRPFTVKEEKILLIAQQSEDIEQVVLAIKQIVSNCVEDINIDTLALFDLEYLLLALRIKSVSNNVKFSVVDPDTKKKVELELDLENVAMEYKEDHSQKIDISEDAFMMMRYPSVNELLFLQDTLSTTESSLETMIMCIDTVVSGDEVYQTEDFSKEELLEFLDTLPSSAIKSIETFFATSPTLRHSIGYVNDNGDAKTFVIEGLQSFFL
jgi:hypothetical protein